MISSLQFIPAKKVPEVFIYYDKESLKYLMTSTVTKSKVGEMDAVFFHSQKSLRILWLLIDKKRKGYGTKFLNFAKNLSIKMGGEGRMQLLAGATVYDDRAPHIFYRKYGFGSDDKKMLKKIDRAIKHKRKLYDTDIDCLEMYYPDTSAKNNKTFLSKAIEHLKNYRNKCIKPEKKENIADSFK